MEKFDRYKFGIEEEENIKELLERFFDDKLYKKGRYDPFDLYGDKVVIEIKSRLNCKNKYPTTLMNKSKIDKIKKLLLQDSSKRYIFVFNFTDGIYYIEYDEEIFKNFYLYKTYTTKCDFYKGYRENVNIPVNLLIQIPLTHQIDDL